MRLAMAHPSSRQPEKFVSNFPRADELLINGHVNGRREMSEEHVSKLRTAGQGDSGASGASRPQICWVRSKADTDKRSVALRLTRRGRARARQAPRRQLDAIAEMLLRSLVSAAADADHICRLCDTQACPPAKRLAHQKALALEAA